MNKSSFVLRCAVIVVLLSSAPTLAMAYIDPGNGAYMVQMLLTIAGAALFYIRRPIRSLKAAWSWLSGHHKQPEELASLSQESDASQAGKIDGSHVNSVDLQERL